MSGYDKEEIRRLAEGRWLEILVAAGLAAELLDGKGHPCPMCRDGGDDRFSAFHDVAQRGAVNCRKCHDQKNGDGFATIRWLKQIDFNEAIRWVAAQLNYRPTPEASTSSEGAIEALARIKHCPAASLRVYGAKEFEDDEGKIVAFPVYSGSKKRCSSFRIWPFSSDKVKLKGKFQYDCDAGLFFPHDENGNPKFPQPGETWVLVEGVKDAAALHSLGYRACGLNTSRLYVKFARLFQGADVILLPDRDQAGDKGAKRSVNSLRGITNTLKLAALPVEWKEKNGDDVRDVLRKPDGENLVRRCIDEAQPVGSNLDFKVEELGLIRALADDITSEHFFARDGGGKLYYFRDGVYRPNGDRFIRASVKSLLNKSEMSSEWTPTLASSVVEYISVDAETLWERPPLDVINLKNGLLRLKDRKLMKHDPSHLSTVQLPVAYDPAATCPNIEKFVADVFPADALDLAWEVPAYLMSPDTSIQKAVLLIGQGGNGKSTWLRMLTEFIGFMNCSGVSLHKLEADRFSAARLFGKLANICPDLPTEHLQGTSVFKSITGGDTLEGEYKFRDSFDFSPFARLVFSANSPPRSQDSSPGFFDRWLVIPFDRPFRGTGEEIPRPELDARLSHPKELSGLLNKALDALPRLKSQRGFSCPESIREAWQGFHATTDPLAVWLDRHTIEDPAMHIPKKTLRVAYGAYLEQKGRPPISEKAFGASFAKLRPAVEPKQKTVGGVTQWCYVGIGLRHQSPPHSPQSSESEETDSQGSQDSQDSSSLFLSHESCEDVVGGEGVHSNHMRTKRGNAVNPVNPVSGLQCCHNDPSTFERRADGYYCPGCDRWKAAL